MTYAKGSLISAADYNTFATNVNAIWGVGTGNRFRVVVIEPVVNQGDAVLNIYAGGWDKRITNVL